MERSYETAGCATLGDLLRPLGPRQTALGAALLALPFLSPVSLGPITTPVSLPFATLGVAAGTVGWSAMRAVLPG